MTTPCDKTTIQINSIKVKQKVGRWKVEAGDILKTSHNKVRSPDRPKSRRTNDASVSIDFFDDNFPFDSDF